MSELIIKFKNNPKLIIKLQNSLTGKIFIDLFKKNRNIEKPLFRDNAKYTKEYLKELSFLIKEKLKWDWISNDYDNLDYTVRLHKDIENLLNKVGDFSKIPAPIQNLIHETHHCIHSVQYYKPEKPHGQFLQIEWFNNDYENLPEDAEFKIDLEFGDVILQNAYVGHAPIQCFMQNDYKNIERTCAFPDRIKPGITITLSNKGNKLFNWVDYENWWKNNCKDFVDKVGFDKIKNYTGFIYIGKIHEAELLEQILKTPLLELEDSYLNE